MSGETDLGALMRTLSAKLHPDTFVFATIPTGIVPAGINPQMVFHESEGTTVICEKAQADAAALAYEFPSRMITLEVHSALEAVGFMALIATELAKHKMGVNPVAGFFHDHVFVPEGRQDDAMAILAKMAIDAGG